MSIKSSTSYGKIFIKLDVGGGGFHHRSALRFVIVWILVNLRESGVMLPNVATVLL